jgi:hypothetical protein
MSIAARNDSGYLEARAEPEVQQSKGPIDTFDHALQSVCFVAFRYATVGFAPAIRGALLPTVLSCP